MKPRHRNAPRSSQGQGPKLGRSGIQERAGEQPSDDAPPDIPPLPIDLPRILEAERRLEHGLAEVEARVWSRIQERLRTGDGGGEHPRAHEGPGAGIRSQARRRRPRADRGSRPPASAKPIASLLDFILQKDVPFIARQIASFGVPSSDVGDVTQEVLCGVFRAVSRYDDSRGKLRTWLYRVAFNQSRTFLGRAHRHREELEATPRDDVSEAAGPVWRPLDPEEQAIRNEDRRLVWDLIEKIEATTRAVFIAHEIMEMTMTEIARALGIPKSTGWGQLQQARRDFTNALRKHRARDAFTRARKRR